MTVAAEQAIVALQFQPLTYGDLLDARVRNASVPDQVLAQHLDASGSNRAHRQVRVARNAKLADEQHVERSGKGRRDFERDRHTASWQGPTDLGESLVRRRVGGWARRQRSWSVWMLRSSLSRSSDSAHRKDDHVEIDIAV